MSWNFIGYIQSETSKNRKYDLEVSEDGDLRCPCASYIHALAPKSCKHTRSALAGSLLRAYWARTQEDGPLVKRLATQGSYLRGGWWSLTLRTDDGLAVVIRLEDLNTLERIARSAHSHLKNPWSFSRTTALRDALRQLNLFT